MQCVWPILREYFMVFKLNYNMYLWINEHWFEFLNAVNRFLDIFDHFFIKQKLFYWSFLFKQKFSVRQLELMNNQWNIEFDSMLKFSNNLAESFFCGKLIRIFVKLIFWCWFRLSWVLPKSTKNFFITKILWIRWK